MQLLALLQGFRVEGLGCSFLRSLEGLGFRVWGAASCASEGFRVEGLGCSFLRSLEGLGLRV